MKISVTQQELKAMEKWLPEDVWATIRDKVLAASIPHTQSVDVEIPYGRTLAGGYPQRATVRGRWLSNVWAITPMLIVNEYGTFTGVDVKLKALTHVPSGMAAMKRMTQTKIKAFWAGLSDEMKAGIEIDDPEELKDSEQFPAFTKAIVELTQ